ncbi:hypothetical protein V8C42DRAFT_342875 [Trichoderma barbatum]
MNPAWVETLRSVNVSDISAVNVSEILIRGVRIPTLGKSGTVSILEHIHSKSPIVWNVTVNEHESTSKLTVISNNVWDATVSELGWVVGPLEQPVLLMLRQWILVQAGNSCEMGQSGAERGSTLFYQSSDLNVEGDAMTIYFTKKISQDGLGNGQCTLGFRDLIYYSGCAGKSQDTRGGKHTYKDSAGKEQELHRLIPRHGIVTARPS